MVAVTLVAITVGVFSFPKWASFQREQKMRAAVASEYQNARPIIWAEIDEAIQNHDLDALLRIHKRYANCVSDRKFKSVVEEGVANLTARETTVELAVAKLLDLTRHREELGDRHLPQPTEKTPPESESKLSVLPK